MKKTQYQYLQEVWPDMADTNVNITPGVSVVITFSVNGERYSFRENDTVDEIPKELVKITTKTARKGARK